MKLWDGQELLYIPRLIPTAIQSSGPIVINGEIDREVDRRFILGRTSTGDARLLYMSPEGFKHIILGVS